MDSLMSDLRVGLRLLWKHRAYTATVVLTLALCLGANVALYCVVRSVLLKPLPFPESDRIVLMMNAYPGAGAFRGSTGVPDYYDRLRETTAFEQLALYSRMNWAIDQGGVPTRVRGGQVTPSFFRLLRATPQVGRAFEEREGEVGNEKRVVLSYALWQTQFGGDPQVVGRDLRLDSRPYTIVGVMPREFAFVDPETMLWTPLAFTAEQKSDDARHSNNWTNIGRLKSGVTIEEAQAQIDALNRANLDRFPQFKQLLINAGFHTIVVPFQDDLVRDVKATLYLLWGGALFVLLIGSVNVANLVLVRSRARQRELAMRLALGANRGRVARQLVTESLVLTVVSARTGLFVGYAALRLLGTLSIQDLPRGSEIRLDSGVVAYALALATVIGVMLGLMPAASALPSSLTTVLHDDGRTGTGGRGTRMLRRTLVVAQVAFAFVLLVGAGLLFTSLGRVLAIDPGFNATGVLTASASLPEARYPDAAARRRFADEALRRLRALPGVTEAGATTTIPFGGSYSDSVILAEGYQMSPGESVISPNRIVVSPGYLEAMGARLIKGRLFEERDNADVPRVAVIDTRLARRFWPGQDPIGRRLYTPSNPKDLMAVTAKTVWYTVVGVVGEMKLRDLVEGDQRVGAYYFAMAQVPAANMTFAVKTVADPRSLATSARRTINDFDRELPVFDLRTMQERTDRSLVTRRSPLMLALAFGALALFLAAIGIYGVLAYLVTERTKEIGIRIALGSSAWKVFELVLREGIVLVGLGLIVGMAGALSLKRALETQLFGVRATDPLVMLLVIGLLGMVALAACLVPARRATRISPTVALVE